MEESIITRMLPKEKSKFKSFSDAIAKALKAFDVSKEWEDLLSALDKLSAGLNAFEPLHKLLVSDSKTTDGADPVDASILNFLPQRYVVAKGVGQCLAPGLPGGLHQRTLQVLAQLFSKCSKDTLARAAYPFLISVFPLFGVATSQVKASILGLYEKFLIPLGDKLLPYYGGLVPSLLHGIETGSESIEKCLALLLCLSTGPYSTTFFEALWKTMLKESSVRMECFTFLAERIKTGDTAWNTSRAALCAICASLLDARILVKRSVLDFICSAAPISSDMFPVADIIRAILPLFSCKEASLNRRVFNYLFNSTISEKSVDPEGDFVRFAKKPLKQTLEYYCKEAQKGNGTLFWLSLCEILLENEIISKHLFNFFLKRSFVLIHQLKAVTAPTLPKVATGAEGTEGQIPQQEFDAFLKQFLGLFETSKLLDFYRYIIDRLGAKFNEKRLTLFIETLDVIPVYEYFDGQDEYLSMFFSATITALTSVLTKSLPQETHKMLTFCERYVKFFDNENVVQFIAFLEAVIKETAKDANETGLDNFKQTLSIFLKMLSDRGTVKEQIGLIQQPKANTLDEPKRGGAGAPNDMPGPSNSLAATESRNDVRISESEMISQQQNEISEICMDLQSESIQQKSIPEEGNGVSGESATEAFSKTNQESAENSSQDNRDNSNLLNKGTGTRESATSFEKFKSSALKASENVFGLLQARSTECQVKSLKAEQKEIEEAFRYGLLTLVVKISDYFGLPDSIDANFLAAEYIELFGKTEISSNPLSSKTNGLLLAACEKYFCTKFAAKEVEVRCDALARFGKVYFYTSAKRNDDRKFPFKTVYLGSFLPFLCADDKMFEEKNLVLSIISENAEKVERIFDPIITKLFKLNPPHGLSVSPAAAGDSRKKEYLNINKFSVDKEFDRAEKLELLKYLDILMSQEQMFSHLRAKKLSRKADEIYKRYKNTNSIKYPASKDGNDKQNDQNDSNKNSGNMPNDSDGSFSQNATSQQFKLLANDRCYYHLLLLTAVIFAKLTFTTEPVDASSPFKSVSDGQLRFESLKVLETFFRNLKEEEKLVLARYLLAEISSLLATEPIHLVRNELFTLYLKILKINASKESGFIDIPEEDLLRIVFGESKTRSFSFFLSAQKYIKCFDTIYATALKLLSTLSSDCFESALLSLKTFHEALRFMILNLRELTKDHLGDIYSSLFNAISRFSKENTDNSGARRLGDFLLEQAMQIFNTLSTAFPGETVAALLSLYGKSDLHEALSCAVAHLSGEQIKQTFSLTEGSFSSKSSAQVPPATAIGFVEMLLKQSTHSFAEHQCSLLSLVRVIQASGMGTKFVCETGRLLHCFFTRKELECVPVNRKEIFDIVASNCENTVSSFNACLQKKVAGSDAKTIFSVFIPSSQNEEKDEPDDWEIVSDDRASFAQLSKYVHDSLLELIWLFFDEKERTVLCVPLMKALVAAVTPGRDLPFTTSILSFFSELCTTKFSPCISLVRKELVQQFLHPYFFAQSDDLLLGWRKIVAFLFSDQQAKTEFLSAVGATLQSTTVLFGKEALVSKKAMCLKQLSYIIYVSDFGALENDFRFITERLIETLRGANDFLIGRVFLCLRMMLYRFDVTLFSEYWPSILTELIGISQRVANDVTRRTAQSPLCIYITELFDTLSLLEDSPLGYNDYIFLPLIQNEQRTFVQFASDTKTQSQCLCGAVADYTPNYLERRKPSQKFCQQQLKEKQEDILKAFKR